MGLFKDAFPSAEPPVSTAPVVQKVPPAYG